jgi:hypothetical protein
MNDRCFQSRATSYQIKIVYSVHCSLVAWYA